MARHAKLMCMLTRRLQILLDEPRWARLSALARRRGVAVAVVVREAIDRALDDPGAGDRDAALERLLGAEPVPVPADPADLRRELAEARDRLS